MQGENEERAESKSTTRLKRPPRKPSASETVKGEMRRTLVRMMMRGDGREGEEVMKNDLSVTMLDSSSETTEIATPETVPNAVSAIETNASTTALATTGNSFLGLGSGSVGNGRPITTTVIPARRGETGETEETAEGTGLDPALAVIGERTRRVAVVGLEIRVLRRGVVGGRRLLGLASDILPVFDFRISLLLM